MKGSSALEAQAISRESAEGAVAGECFDVGAVCDGHRGRYQSKARMQLPISD